MKKSFDRNKKKPFNRGSERSFEQYREGMNPTDARIEQIDISQKDKRFNLHGMVDSVEQTGGPTIFYITDGTGLLALKAFEGAGVRAYPEINIGDAVSATVTIQEFNNELEGEVSKMSKLTEDQKKDLLNEVAETERKRAEVVPIPFLVQDVILEKLKDRFLKAAGEIRLAIIQNRPIVIRHHNDTDGYSSGFALERAILPLIVKQHNSVKSAWEFYTRAPCNAPLYEIDDSIRDTSHSLSHAAKFSNKMPLILIVDTGSGKEDLLGIQQGRVHGIDFIVVDHHTFEEDVISAETLVHINPFLVGEDGSKYSAGMLCTELARFINPVENILPIPALAGLADRIDNPKTMEGYLEHAAKRGYDKELLGNISTVIDFVSSKLRFMEAREYIEVLFGEPIEKQKALVSLLAPYIRNLESKGLAIAKSAVKTEKIGKTTVQIISIETTYPRGFYPKPGRCVSLLHDWAQEEKKETNLVTLGVLTDAMTIRATEESTFSVQELIEKLETELPDAYVEGGGHKKAGSIKFLPNKQQEVLAITKEYIRHK